ncbi:MAG: efflux transporter periplasmic adaptor subunit [Gammaproteobacteria bacterium CG11_big_fil_rev_8_21_14_0_20_46_22]|nr:MAG: efflux transporter periplasmic adaptor subunit [Gammaproteobacteria bacterium CG12_big_fil_rev_8_21_14_0_65_46_12]PIR11820.1 MAG: efflux transporter periplasmic adaptor subunit [Gammaproteobacteria bacterium CG11_big_fil_rev_8_21_14_0_20_46_22]
MKASKSILWVVVIVLCLVIVFALGWWLSRSTSTRASTTASSQTANKKPLYWVAPMNPSYRRDKPGKSPMGMDLVPVYEEPSEAGVVKISPTVENNLGVRTAVVEKRHFNQQIRTVGYVQPDENTLQTMSVYTEGWIKDLQVKAAGEPVKQGQLLFKLYSPVLVSAQEEYLLAIKYHNPLLIRAGKQKLITLGMSAKDIDQLASARQAQQNVPVYAPQSGYITQLNVREGAHVMPATPLMSIANLSTVWVIAEVYEQQAALLKTGQRVSARFNGLPGKIIKGKVDYIYPTLNAKTRTVRVRLVFANPNTQLKPAMYANITIDAGHSLSVVAIPKEALIQLGDTNRVVLALGDGKFKPVTVKVGQQNQDWVAITEGLTPGQKVVTSAQFLLDSESNLKAGLKRLSNDQTNSPSSSGNKKMKPTTNPNHTGH